MTAVASLQAAGAAKLSRYQAPGGGALSEWGLRGPQQPDSGEVLRFPLVTHTRFGLAGGEPNCARKGRRK